MLRHHRASAHPSLVVGLESPDDAAVWRLDDKRALVQTVDFFPPIVDDPRTFGAISAANALSDVYAMGGTPFLALAIAAFPDDLPIEILGEILRGGAEVAASVGVVVAGGHTVIDAEPKYGLCVTGMVDPARVLTKGAIRPGDRLFITKPVGTGVVTTAIKRSVAPDHVVATAIETMLEVNARAAGAIATVSEVRACTDVTGYALAGHASEMAVASGVAISITWARVPLLPGVTELADAGHVPGGTRRNQEYLMVPEGNGRPARLTIDASLGDRATVLACDPQTSGGLLFSAPPAATSRIIDAFARAGVPVWEIGEARSGSGVSVV